MKKRNLLSGLFLAALMSLGIAGTAHAQLGPYTCNEGGNPPPASGAPDGYSIIRGESPPGSQYDTCTLGSLVTQHGFFADGFTTYNIGNIDGGDGDIAIALSGAAETNTGNLTAATQIVVNGAHNLGTVTAGTSGSGYIEIGGIANLSTGAITNTNGHVKLVSLGTITTPSITNKNGDVRVFANSGQSSGSPLTIGAGGIGYIHNNGTFGYGIYVSNPYGINYNGTNLLQVHAGSGNTGAIILDTGHFTGGVPDGTNTGTVTLAGTIKADASTSGAGYIDIFAAQIVANKITLSASAPGAQVGVINLVTNSIIDNSGLTINLNGNGQSANSTDLAIYPIGSYSVVSANDITQPVSFSNFTTSTNPLVVSGAGAFAITANGNNNGLQIRGYPLTMNPKSTTITQHGNGDFLFLASTDGGALYNTLTFGGVVKIHENTTAPGAQNPIDVRGTNIASPLTGNVLLDASGIAGGGGDGSNINLSFDSGSMSLGGTGKNFTLNSNGSSTGGKAGNITAGNGGTLAITLNSGVAVTASALGGDGVGGTIKINAGSIVTGNATLPQITADGHGNGLAGNITLTASSSNPMKLDNSTISASGDIAGGGNGNTITITTAGSSSVNGATFNANGGGTGGDGGHISLTNSVFPNVPTDLSGRHTLMFSAKGGLNGIGGKVDLVQVIALTAESPWNTGFIDVNKIINVDGNGTGISTFDGYIDINGVHCVQIPVSGSGPWPTTYWDCTNGNAALVPTVPVTAAALQTPTYVLQSYANGHVNLYAMSDLQAWNSFFGVFPAQADNRDGTTFNTSSGYVYSSVFALITDDMGQHATRSPAVVTAHELGHALDIVWGLVSIKKGTGTFGTALVKDTNAINGAACAIAFAGTVMDCSTKPASVSNMDFFFNVFFGGVTQSPQEMFAYIFEHQQLAGEGDLEAVLAKFTNMNSYMTTARTTSSHP